MTKNTRKEIKQIILECIRELEKERAIRKKQNTSVK
jgi:hypothetical protein